MTKYTMIQERRSGITYCISWDCYIVVPTCIEEMHTCHMDGTPIYAWGTTPTYALRDFATNFPDSIELGATFSLIPASGTIFADLEEHGGAIPWYWDKDLHVALTFSEVLAFAFEYPGMNESGNYRIFLEESTVISSKKER